ncbi:ABC transporter ATP-binding protein [Ottowia sp.]|uniref:ABC transporter ATP-binding protein n=1 Tax=Ottowia sp. TaxID=1898956 RepID=UPI0039E28B0C
MASIDIQAITKRFGSVTALNHIDLQVRQGEFLTLLGPSGSGKTTLLTMIAGLDSPDEGRIVIGQKDVTHLPTNQRNIGLVFQSYALFPHMTVFDNVAFPLRVRGRPADAIQQEVAKALATVKLDGFAQRKPAQLSGGQQQRVALARAIVFEPAILLLDEPLGALDKNLREDLQFELRQLHHTLGITTIMVTHDQEEAMSLSDRIAVFNAGRIEQIGAPEHIYRNPATPFVANFFGTGNLLRGQVASLDGQPHFQSAEGLRLPAPEAAMPGTPLEIMLRPESIRLASPHSGANQIVGQVIGRVYLGATIRYRVRLPDGQVMAVQASSSDGEYRENDSVALNWSGSDMRVLGAEAKQ